jgi:carboxyl-terminal processing protease
MEQARLSLSEMLAKLKQSHFAIIPSDLYKEIQPASKSRAPADRLKTSARTKSAADSAKREEECGVGIEAAVVDGTARVVAIEGGSPAARAGVRTGWELISVGGYVLAETMSLLTGTDLTERELFERALLNQPFLGPLDESVETVFRDEGGHVHQLVLDRVEPKGNLAQFGFLPQARVWIEARQLEGPIGYVRFNLFLDPEHLMPAYEKAVRDCSKCQGFVIDLRGNPGGIGPMAMGMAGWFINRTGRRLGALKARDYSLDFEVNPRADTFDGPLAVLVDGASASTSEIFAAGLQDLGRARVFGTKTAGAALPSVFIRLPNLDGFQYAEATYTSRNGRVLEGGGVTPDVVVTHTRESLLAGRDAALDAALNWIKTK